MPVRFLTAYLICGILSAMFYMTIIGDSHSVFCGRGFHGLCQQYGLRAFNGGGQYALRRILKEKSWWHLSVSGVLTWRKTDKYKERFCLWSRRLWQVFMADSICKAHFIMNGQWESVSMEKGCRTNGYMGNGKDIEIVSGYGSDVT